MTQGQLRPVWAEINLGNFKKNLQAVKGLIPKDAAIFAVVKANAYGIGAIPASRAALQVEGVTGLAVATPDEAIELRGVSIQCPILLLGPSTNDAARVLVHQDVSITVTSKDAIDSVEAAGKLLGKKAKIHLKIDTGMGRIGFAPGKELEKVLDLLKECNNIQVEGMFTHFSSADANKDYTFEQWARFQDAVGQARKAGIHPTYLHSSNSAAILDFPQSHLDLVRPGIMIYGSYPSPALADKAVLYPVFSLKARISHTKIVGPGTYIGYGMTYKTSSSTVIATVPVGYADGYPRLLSNVGSVLIKGQAFPIAGRICMDQFMVNLGSRDDIHPGELVTLIGRDGDNEVTVDKVAEQSQTIAHEVLTGITCRVPRVYL